MILASGSAARRQILAASGVPFTALAPDIDEHGLKDRLVAAKADLAGVADALAEAKALDISRDHPDILVLGADQTLLFDGELVSKCADLPSARALLTRLRGKPHQLFSALVLARAGGAVWRHTSTTTLHMRSFSDVFLDSYLSTEGEGILGCVGCYRFEGLGAQLFDSVEGDYFSILGLPLQPLLAELRRQGVIAR